MPFALAGFSFGARVITALGCECGGARFLLAAGFPTRWAAPTTWTCAVPKIFIQSTHDQYGPRAELEAVYARFAEPKQLVWIEAGDHFFAGALEQVEEAARGASA